MPSASCRNPTPPLQASYNYNDCIISFLQATFQATREFLQVPLIPPVPHPVAYFLGFDQFGLGENRHVMGNGGLRQWDSFFDIGGAKTHVLGIDGTSSFFLEGF